MATSLLLAGFDVCNPASSVKLADGWDRGAPVPSVAEIQSTVLDGAVVSGSASGNRNVTIPLLILGTSRAELAVLTNQVLMYVDQQNWTLTFTPDGGSPITYDCFRATSEIASAYYEDEQLCQRLTITCEALPYGRSSAAQSFALIAPPPVVIDNYDTKPTITPTTPYNYNTNTAVVTSPVYNGTHALQITYPTGTVSVPVTIAKTGLSIAVANGVNSVTLAVMPDFDAANWQPPWQWSLTVTVGGINYTASAVAAPAALVWSQITFNFATPIPAGTVTAYSLVIPVTNLNSSFHFHLVIDYLVAYPASGVRGTSTWGSEYILPAVVGSARTPVNLQLTPPSGTFAQMCLHAPPNDTPDSECLLTINDSTPPGAVTTPSGVRYGGTYSIWVSFKAASSLTAGNTITLTISQGSASAVLTHLVTADEHAQGTLHMLLHFGEVALPLVAIPAQNSQLLTFTVASSGLAGTDTIGDVLVLDTRGQTVLTDIDTPASEAVWVNEPAPGSAFGAMYSSPSTGTLADALSITGNVLTGAPMWLYPPGNSRLLVWCNTLAPTAVLTYYPRWLQEATA